MKATPAVSKTAHKAFVHAVAELWPIARGSLSEVRKPCTRPECQVCASGAKHPALIYTYWENGKHKCRHVTPEVAPLLRQAIENWRQVEHLAETLGDELLQSYRRNRDGNDA